MTRIETVKSKYDAAELSHKAALDQLEALGMWEDDAESYLAQAAREVFNQVIATQTDADKIARIEIACEYFTNPTFAKALAEHLWEAQK